jgi:hypothetical protein
MRIGKESSLKGKQELLRDTRNLWFKLSRSLSDEEGAEEVHRQALRLQETLLGKEHPDTVTSMNNLALVLRGQGKYEHSLLSLRIFIMSFDAFVSIPVHNKTSGFKITEGSSLIGGLCC